MTRPLRPLGAGLSSHGPLGTRVREELWPCRELEKTFGDAAVYDAIARDFVPLAAQMLDRLRAAVGALHGGPLDATCTN